VRLKEHLEGAVVAPSFIEHPTQSLF